MSLGTGQGELKVLGHANKYKGLGRCDIKHMIKYMGLIDQLSMDKPTQIGITINGKTHQLSADNIEAMKQIPWPERKELIQLLDAIKQAEHVTKAKQSVEDKPVRQTITPINKMVKPLPKLDQEVKKSSADVDDIMNQLIIQQQQKSSVPDKQDVYKWFLIVFVLIVVVAMIF